MSHHGKIKPVFLCQTIHLLWPPGKSGQWLVQSVLGHLQELLEGVCQVQFSFPDKLLCEWPQRLSPSRYLLPFPYHLFIFHPPTLVPSLPARGICSKTLAHEERKAPQFNWPAPCKAALFHYKLSKQAESPQNSKAGRGAGHVGM